MGKMRARLNGFYCYRHLLKQLVQKDIKPVSYTHLTLPTILLV